MGLSFVKGAGAPLPGITGTRKPTVHTPVTEWRNSLFVRVLFLLSLLVRCLVHDIHSAIRGKALLILSGMLHPSVLWWVFIAAVVAGLTRAGWKAFGPRRTRERKTYAISDLMGKALDAEQARSKTPNVGPSLLPAGTRYDRSLGELDLWDPAKSSVDDTLIALCRRFAPSDPAGRSRLRTSASLDDFYTLLSLSHRCAVFAMRERQTRIILGQAEIEISEKFGQVAHVYADNPVALHLRAMNMLYEAIKEKGLVLVVPASGVETMGLGGTPGTVALEKHP
jgi:hypothetical protein